MIELGEKGRYFFVWTFTKSARMYQEWQNWGHKFDTVGCFDFLIPDDTGIIVGVIPPIDLKCIAKFPDTQYLLTVRNDGIASRFAAIVANTGGAQDTFISELHRILDTYPWADGVDIDLENGPTDNQAEVIALAQRIYNEIKGRPSQNWVHWDLPCMYGDDNPYWMRWCSYGGMAPYFDSCAIMSYAFSWSGSAPDAISPIWWMDWIYDYAITRINKEKILMGVPGFGFRWQIYYKPTDYRGVGWTYLAALAWMHGLDCHNADQPYIPFAAFHDAEKGCPYMHLHIYDYLEGWDTDAIDPPAIKENYRDRNYIVCYERIPKYSWDNVIIDRGALSYDGLVGNWDIGEGYIAPLATDAIATYNFNVSQAGTYKIIGYVSTPWWDRQLLVTSHGNMGPFDDWYPLHRRVHWIKIWEGNLAAGNNTFQVLGNGSQFGTIFWGFRICSDFSMSMYGSGGNYTLSPRRMKAKDGNWVLPNNFILTSEVLRHPPAYAWVWYDDFVYNQSEYYNTFTGTWVWDTENKILKQTDINAGDAQIHLDWYEFGDLNVLATLKMIAGSGTMGVLFKVIDANNLYLFLLRRSTQTAELWKRVDGVWTQIGSSINQSVDLGIWYDVRIRCRGTELRCWVSDVLKFSVDENMPASGGFGLRSDNTAFECNLIDSGRSTIYVPQEAIDVTPLGAGKQTLGRIARNGVNWLYPWEYFEFIGPGEEFETRSEDIPADFDFLHTDSFDSFEDNRQVTIGLRDRGIWLTNLYLGDALGFSLAYYADVENFNILANLAKHKWGLKGTALWSLGQQDPLLFRELP